MLANKPARFSYFDFDSISIRLVGYESRFDYRFDFFQKKIKHEPKIYFRFERININILKVSGKRDSLADVTVFPPSDQTRSLGAAVAGIDSRIFAHCMRLGNLLPFCSCTVCYIVCHYSLTRDYCTLIESNRFSIYFRFDSDYYN